MAASTRAYRLWLVVLLFGLFATVAVGADSGDAESISISDIEQTNPPTSSDMRVNDEPGDAIVEESYIGSNWELVQFGIGLGTILGMLIVFVPLIATQDGRRMLFKGVHIARNTVVADIGIGGFFRLLITSSVTALIVALTRGFQNDGFHWDTFFLIFFVVALVGVVANVVTNSAKLRALLSPGAGNQWRGQRKIGTAGVIEKINESLKAERKMGADEVRGLVSEILDLIVLHIRDHRASNRDTIEVFANLLLDDGDSLVVVARDNHSSSSKTSRMTPQRYPKGGMLAAEAIEHRKATSVGMITHKFPLMADDKPYHSVIAIPVVVDSARPPIGAICVDSSRPYFFQSVVPDDTENRIENNLLPYIKLITLVIESALATDMNEMVRELSELPPPPPGGVTPDEP